MRFCFIGSICIVAAMQLAACKTPAMAGSGDNTLAHETAAASTTDTSTATKPANRNPGIISVILNVAQQGRDVSWSIGSVSVSAGRFKHNFAGARPDYLHAYFTDDAGQRIDSNLFENPLQPRIEAPTEQGKFTSALANNASGSTYLRANNNSAITMLHIYSADNRKLASFNLTEYLKK